MKVLIHASPRFFATRGFGGGAVQVFKTVECLNNLGVDAVISRELRPNLDGVDIIHLYGTLEPHYTYLRAKNAVSQKKPIALSTVFWSWIQEELLQEEKLGYSGLGKYMINYKSIFKNYLPANLLAIYYKIKKRWENMPYWYYVEYIKLEREFGTQRVRKKTMQMADILLPNSEIEYKYLQDNIGISKSYFVIPNATDLAFESGNVEAFEDKYGIKDFVLCVAAITPRKNQLRVIKAMKDIDVPLVLIGKVESQYAKLCKSEADNKVLFLGQINHDELRNAYAAAKVHVLASFYETPGIASLEAALAGCVIVTTDRGCTKEYFGDEAIYCNPAEEDSIKQAILQALKLERGNNLQEKIKKEFTWEIAAKKTIEAYQMVLGKR